MPLFMVSYQTSMNASLCCSPAVSPISSFSCPLSFWTSPVLSFIPVLNLVPIAFYQSTCSLTASPGRDLGSFLGNISSPYFYPGLASLRVTTSPPHLAAASILLKPENHGGDPSAVMVGDIPHSGSLLFPQRMNGIGREHTIMGRHLPVQYHDLAVPY
jgi:hypothetical protein